MLSNDLETIELHMKNIEVGRVMIGEEEGKCLLNEQYVSDTYSFQFADCGQRFERDCKYSFVIEYKGLIN